MPTSSSFQNSSQAKSEAKDVSNTLPLDLLDLLLAFLPPKDGENFLKTQEFTPFSQSTLLKVVGETPPSRKELERFAGHYIAAPYQVLSLVAKVLSEFHAARRILSEPAFLKEKFSRLFSISAKAAPLLCDAILLGMLKCQRKGLETKEQYLYQLPRNFFRLSMAPDTYGSFSWLPELTGQYFKPGSVVDFNKLFKAIKTKIPNTGVVPKAVIDLAVTALSLSHYPNHSDRPTLLKSNLFCFILKLSRLLMSNMSPHHEHQFLRFLRGILQYVELTGEEFLYLMKTSTVFLDSIDPAEQQLMRAELIECFVEKMRYFDGKTVNDIEVKLRQDIKNNKIKETEKQQSQLMLAALQDENLLDSSPVTESLAVLEKSKIMTVRTLDRFEQNLPGYQVQGDLPDYQTTRIGAEISLWLAGT